MKQKIQHIQLPFVSRKEYEAEQKARVDEIKAHADDVKKLNAQIQAERTKHAQELEETKKRVDEFVRKITRLDWTRNNREVYNVTLSFDARIMMGHLPRPELDYMAEMLTRQMRHEIASARFMQRADEAESERRGYGIPRYKFEPKD